MVKRRGIVLSPSDLHERWPSWLDEAGLNVLGLHASVPELISFSRSPERQSRLSDIADRGIDLEYETHAMSWLLPRDGFRTHPDQYRMGPDGRRMAQWNLCASNTEALETVAQNAVQLATVLPTTTHRFYFWADDGKPWCSCRDCSTMSPSDQNLLVMNRVLAGLRDLDPHSVLSCLAYLDTLEAPSEVRPSSGISLEFAPIGRSYASPLGDEGSPENCEHVSKLDRLLAWFGTRNAQVLEYWLDASRFSKWRRPAVKVPFDPEIMRSDVDFYVKKGFSSMTSFGVYLDEEYLTRYGRPPIADYGEILRSQ